MECHFYLAFHRCDLHSCDGNFVCYIAILVLELLKLNYRSEVELLFPAAGLIFISVIFRKRGAVFFKGHKMRGRKER